MFCPLAAYRVRWLRLRRVRRQGKHSAVFCIQLSQPLLNVIAAECREKLNVDDLTFDTTDLHAADIAGRARAFQSLINGGMALDQAAGLSGLLIDDD